MSKCLSVGFFLSAPARLGIVWTGDFWSNCITKKLFFFLKVWTILGVVNFFSWGFWLICWFYKTKLSVLVILLSVHSGRENPGRVCGCGCWRWWQVKPERWQIFTSYFFLGHIFWDIFGGSATIHTHWEIQCLLTAGFFFYTVTSRSWYLGCRN